MDPFPPAPDTGEPDADGYIRNPRDSDVLCGRGGALPRHPGNQTYIRLVNLNKGLYSTCPKAEKIKISRSIVAAIRDQKGRFLKEHTRDVWENIGDSKAVTKTSQALREGQPELIQNIAEMSALELVVGGGDAGNSNNSMILQLQLQQRRQHILQQERQEQLQQQQNLATQGLLQQQQQYQQQLQEQQYLHELLRQQQELFHSQNNGSFHPLSPNFLSGSNQSIVGALPAVLNGFNHSMGSVVPIGFLSDSSQSMGVGNNVQGSAGPINFGSDSHHSTGSGNNFQIGNNPNVSTNNNRLIENANIANDLNTRLQNMQDPTPINSSSRQAELHADMLQRLTLHDMQAVAASTNGDESNNLTFEQQQQCLRESLTSTRASLVKELSIVESNLSLMSELAEIGTGASGAFPVGGSMAMNSHPSRQEFAAGQTNESVGMLSADSSYKLKSGSPPSGGSSDPLSLDSPSMQSLGENGTIPILQLQFKGSRAGSSPAVIAAATAAAVNSNNTSASGNNRSFDRRRLFATTKHSGTASRRQENKKKPAAQHKPLQGSNNSTSVGIPPSSEMQQNVSGHSMDELLTSGFPMVNSNNILEGTNWYSAMSNATGLSSSHDSKLLAAVPLDHNNMGSVYSNVAAAAVPGPSRVIVETAKVIDHSNLKLVDRDWSSFGDNMSSGSGHSIMSGVSGISGSSVDQSIFSDLSNKIGNVSTRSIGMSECSNFDITEAGDDDNVHDNDDDDFAQGRAAVEGGPGAITTEIEFQFE